jgi:hypothetical protein
MNDGSACSHKPVVTDKVRGVRASKIGYKYSDSGVSLSDDGSSVLIDASSKIVVPNRRSYRTISRHYE